MPPPEALAAACRARADIAKDARFLPPALAALRKEEAVQALPKLLQLAAPDFAAALARLLVVLGPSGMRQ